MKKALRKLDVCKMIKISVFALFITIFSYVYLVNAATFNTAKAQKLTQEIALLKSNISQSELEYIAKTKSITIDDAAAFNLIPSDKNAKKIVVSRDNSTKLTLNTVQ